MPTIVTLAMLPPSVNGIFRNVHGRGRVKTKAYKAWLKAAGWEVNCQKPIRIAGKVEIDITCKRPSGNSDIDNRVKAALDLLVTMNLIDDDRYVERVRAQWGAVEGCQIVISPAAVTLEVAA